MVVSDAEVESASTEPVQVPCIAVGAVTDDWAVELVSERDGWRFGCWLPRGGPGVNQPLLVSPDRSLRFITFDAALSFLRREYAPLLRRHSRIVA